MVQKTVKEMKLPRSTDDTLFDDDDSVDVETTPVTDDDIEVLPINETARFSASLGITVEANGKLAWPKFGFSDTALPGEDAVDAIARANDYALSGVYELAKQSLALMRQVDLEDKEERIERARAERNSNR